MRYAGIFAICLTLPAVFGLQVADRSASDNYFESAFDGVWTGFLSYKTEGNEYKLFAALNLNVQGSGGGGFALIAMPSETVGLDDIVITVLNLQAKGRKISFSFDLNEPGMAESGYTPLIMSLKLKLKKGILKGTFESSDFILPKGSAEFHPPDPNKPLQGVWYGTARGFGVSLQFLQNSTLTGAAIFAFDYTVMEEGKFDGKKLTAVFRDEEITYDVDMNLKKGKLKGTFTTDSETIKLTLYPLGTKSKRISIASVSPSEVTAGDPFGVTPGATTELTIKGKNFPYGAAVHLDNPDIEVCCVSFDGSTQIRCNISVPSSVADGTQVGVRVVNPDGLQAEKAAAFTVMADSGGGGMTVSLANDIQPVFDAHCVTCHGSGGSAGLNLSSGVSYANIVDIPSSEMPQFMLIKPGDPSNSYLIRKIKGEGISGSRMPLGGAPLSPATIATFETWVNEGAQNN